MEIQRTVAKVDGASFDAIEAWIKANIKDKLPADASVDYNYTVIP